MNTDNMKKRNRLLALSTLTSFLCVVCEIIADNSINKTIPLIFTYLFCIAMIVSWIAVIYSIIKKQHN